MSGQRREAQQLARRLAKLPGITVGRNGHWKVYRDGRLIVTFGFSPSCSRALKNTVSDLKRAGVVL
jgi:hypothetical protein